MGRLTARDVCYLHSYARRLMENSEEQEKSVHDSSTIALLYFFGSWNMTAPTRKSYENDSSYTIEEQQQQIESELEKIMPSIMSSVVGSKNNNTSFTHHYNARTVIGSVQVDESDENLQLCLGDDGAKYHVGPDILPENLPCLAMAVQHSGMEHSYVQFMPEIDIKRAAKSRNMSTSYPSSSLNSILSNSIILLKAVMSSVLSAIPPMSSTRTQQNVNEPQQQQHDEEAIRIFVAGDRSNAGKSSICLGILGYLVTEMGYSPSSLAYIKPATQCESPQLIQKYCENVGISCNPIGPIVYYKGFTRAHLAGETEFTTAELLENAGNAVDKIAQGKRLVMIDGVGFPSVGSICGTDNVQVAKASGYPQQNEGRNPPATLLVGISGVGAAVDAYNLNATYFDYSGVPVIGAVFNKLSQEGFYSLENCKKQVTAYFDQQDNNRQAFGFVPLFSGFAAHDGNVGDDSCGLDCVDEFIQLFGEYVDVRGIVNEAINTKNKPPVDDDQNRNHSKRNSQTKQQQQPIQKKKPKIFHISSAESQSQLLSRQAIEQRAAKSGAAPSA